MFSRIKLIVVESEKVAERLGKQLVFSGQTNLSRLNEDMVEFSRTHDIAWGISLDGSPEINDQFRVTKQGEGTYKLFETALSQFPEFVRACSIMTTVTSATDEKLLEIARHFRELGLSAWDWALFQRIGRGRNSTKYEYSIDRLLDSWDRLFHAVEEGEFEGFRVGPVYWYLDNFLNGPGGNMCMRRNCGAGRDLLSISPDGTIEACDCIDPLGPNAGLGQVSIIDVESLSKARQSPKADLIRSRDVTLGDCNSCIWLSVCGGTCGAHADSLHGVAHNECAIALNAFEKIATSLAKSTRLRSYHRSVCKPHRVRGRQAETEASNAG